jgi:16S rRNA (guanine966-N2)-methyltransferase
MRIVAGALRGRTVVAPKGHSTRPTADRTRQAVFNVLEHATWSRGLEGARVLDLFAGSGALGLEALSRGAASCLFVDLAQAARSAIETNIRTLSLTARTSVAPFDAARLGAPPRGTRFDLAFLDPPYGQGLDEAALARLARHDWLEAGAIVIVERGAAEASLAAPDFETLDVRAWGAAQIHFLRRGSAPAE